MRRVSEKRVWPPAIYRQGWLASALALARADGFDDTDWRLQHSKQQPIEHAVCKATQSPDVVASEAAAWRCQSSATTLRWANSFMIRVRVMVTAEFGSYGTSL